MSASLTTSYTGRPCPGEDVTLTCTVTGNRLTWESESEGSGVISVINFVRGFTMVNATGGQGGISAVVTSITNTTITSTLIITGTFLLHNQGIILMCKQVGLSVTVQSAGIHWPWSS